MSNIARNNRYRVKNKIDEQIDYLQVTDTDRNLLHEIAPYVIRKLPDIIEQFYQQLGNYSETKIFLSNPVLVDRLKKAQSQYFKNLFEAAFDTDYISKRKEIGNTHVRIGLEPRWYIGGYSLFCNIIFPILREIYPEDTKKLQQAELALLKAFYLDMQIALETYIDRYSSELIETRTALEQKLWMEDRLLTSILNQSTDAIIGLDEQGRISTWSQGAQRIFGYRITEILDKSISDLIVDQSILAELKEEADRNGSATMQGPFWSKKDGQIINANATLTHLNDRNGIHVGMTLMVQDLTEMRHLAEKVKSMEQLSAMTKITAGVAHEIRNPLGVIALTADMIEEHVRSILQNQSVQVESDKVQEVNELISDLQMEVVRLNEIVDHYLVLSRIKNPNKITVDIGEYLRDIVQELESRHDDAKVRILLNIENDFQASIDPTHFRRVFLNLYENSHYAIKETGVISITARTDNSLQGIIEFSDNGCGIARENLDRIFSAFVTNKSGGTGLGLYLVHEIVQAHDGAVTIDSELGIGTTLSITLPLVQKEVETHAI